MAAATLIPLSRVECVSTTIVPSAFWYLPVSGSSSTAAARGSALAGAGSCSFATSSDCTANRAGMRQPESEGPARTFTEVAGRARRARGGSRCLVVGTT
jgi:hypothetical protein